MKLSFSHHPRLSACYLTVCFILLLWVVFWVLYLSVPKDKKHQKILKGVKSARTTLHRSRDPENPAIPIHLLYQPGFKLLPKKNVCPSQGEKIKVMVLVTSAVDHAEHREEIRFTWGTIAARSDAGLAFVVGISKEGRLNHLIEQENALYGDIIQGWFTDTYNNLTLKTISALEWSWKYCSDAIFYFKVDDDVFVNPSNLIAFSDSASSYTNSVIGEIFREREPVRDTNSKYYVDTLQFNGNMYPDFSTGPAYILTNDVIKVLYETALNQTFFKLEDVLITGISAEILGIKRIHNNNFLNNPSEKQLSNYQLSRIIALHSVGVYNRADLWAQFIQGKMKYRRKHF